MEKTNALRLRQNMGAVIRQLQENGQPILVEKGKKPVAVLISIDDYKKRFVDVDADILRKDIVAAIKKSQMELPEGLSSLDLIHELRG